LNLSINKETLLIESNYPTTLLIKSGYLVKYYIVLICLEIGTNAIFNLLNKDGENTMLLALLAIIFGFGLPIVLLFFPKLSMEIDMDN